MDESALKEALIREANKDIFDGVGRIILEDFERIYLVSREEVLSVLKLINVPLRIVNDHIVLIYFTRRLPPAERFDARLEEAISEKLTHL